MIFSPGRLLAILALLFVAFATQPASAQGRVIVLGFDGADHDTTEKMMEEGQLKNLARLKEMGTFAPLISTQPAESAAGWAALNTGLNPAKNGVPSFFGREMGPHGPRVDTFHIGIGPKKIDEFKHTGLMKLYVENDPFVLGLGVGVAVFLMFFLVFAFLLRVNKMLALVLAVLLGAGGAFGTLSAESYVPRSIPKVFSNKIEADGFWAVAAEAGVDSIVLDAALAFDREPVDGARVLAGLGLPDSRGDIGQWFVYTDSEYEFDKESSTSSGSGTVYKVHEREGKIRANLPGPVNFWEVDKVQRELDAVDARLKDQDLGWKESNRIRNEVKPEIEKRLSDLKYSDSNRVSLPVVVEYEGTDRIRLTIGNQTKEIAEGEWSEWFRLVFDINPLIKVKAVTRAKLVSMPHKDVDEDSHFELLINTLDIDPSDAPFWQPVSQPADFSAELAEWIQEPYETLGWACMTNGVKDKRVDIETFLEDIEFTMGFRRKLTRAALERGDWRVLFSVFSVTDRVQHMMYKYYDPGHPYYKEEEASRVVAFFGEEIQLKEVIPAIYRQMDDVVGEVMDRYLLPEDTLLLCADHGFTSYRRGLHVNNWLASEGYLTIKEGLGKRDEGLLEAIDFSKTKAYGLGLGMIFVNEVGENPHGIVPPEEKRALLEEIKGRFELLVDGETGLKVGREAVIMEGFYTGEYLDRCADMMLGFEEFYRISWESAIGEIQLQVDKDTKEVVLAPIFNNNSNNWSGDHASNAPEVVSGIFFSNRPVVIPEDGVSVMHIAPTVLDRVNVPIPEAYDRPPLAAE